MNLYNSSVFPYDVGRHYSEYAHLAAIFILINLLHFIYLRLASNQRNTLILIKLIARNEFMLIQ